MYQLVITDSCISYKMKLESLFSYNFVPIEGFSPEIINSTLFASLLLILTAILLYIQSKRFREIHPEILPQVEAVRNDLAIGNARAVPHVRELPADAVCPICMLRPTLPVETNCGHLFCINCFMLYRTHVGDFNPALCPMCRGRVTLLMLTQPREAYIVDEENLNKVAAYNRRHSGEPRSLMEQLLDTPALLRHLWRAFFTPGMLHLTYALRILTVCLTIFIYLISPLDLLPESVFGVVGLIDDILVTLFLLCLAGNIFRAFLVERAYRND